MMIIVEAFTDGTDRHAPLVFSWANVFVIGFASPHVGCRVEEPGHMQSPAIAEKCTNEVSLPYGFTPQFEKDISGHDKAAQKNEK